MKNIILPGQLDMQALFEGIGYREELHLQPCCVMEIL